MIDGFRQSVESTPEQRLVPRLSTHLTDLLDDFGVLPVTHDNGDTVRVVRSWCTTKEGTSATFEEIVAPDGKKSFKYSSYGHGSLLYRDSWSWDDGGNQLNYEGSSPVNLSENEVVTSPDEIEDTYERMKKDIWQLPQPNSVVESSAAHNGTSSILRPGVLDGMPFNTFKQSSK